jgi:hypothetical protein
MSASPVSTHSSESVQSETSTLVYDHEPFEQYASRVKALVRIRWPSVAEEDIALERMKGGALIASLVSQYRKPIKQKEASLFYAYHDSTVLRYLTI